LSSFSASETYESLVGKWSEMIARDFVKWVPVPRGSAVLDVGCGTGALSRVLLGHGAGQVTGVDPSPSFVEYARARSQGDARKVSFQTGDTMSLALPDASFDAVVSGLVLNFIPDPAKGLHEMVRVARVGGVVAAYVWDYQEKMELSRRFWDAAKSVDASAEAHDEGRRFVVCRPESLRALFLKAGLEDVASGSLETEMEFNDFNECWSLLLKAQGPFAAFFAKLDDRKRELVRSRFQRSLRTDNNGRIRMNARAWTVRGTRLLL